MIFLERTQIRPHPCPVCFEAVDVPHVMTVQIGEPTPVGQELHVGWMVDPEPVAAHIRSLHR